MIVMVHNGLSSTADHDNSNGWLVTKDMVNNQVQIMIIDDDSNG